MATATLHVTKLAAAKRQLQCAIRLFFRHEDDLAIHTLASAVYGLLKGIKQDRGMDEAADTHRISIFYVVRDFRRGTLPSEFTSNPKAMAEIEGWANALTLITADSKIEDVKVAVPQEFARAYWNKTNRVANFLKHADRDAAASIAEADIDNQLLISKCCIAYRDVAPDDLDNEGFVFAAFVSAGNASYTPNDQVFGRLVTSLRQLPESDWLRRCDELITGMRAL